MPMDGILISRLVDTLNEACPLKINRITQPTQYDFIFQVFGQKRQKLLISAHPLYNRIQFTETPNKPNMELTHFLSVLRKYLDGALIHEVSQSGFDRIVTISLSYRDEMGVIQELKLILELMGRNANLILVDANGKIIDAFRRTGNFQNNQRVIASGALYEMPTSLNKNSIKELSHDDKNHSIRSKYEGISPVLEKEITVRLDKQEPHEIVDDLLNSKTMYVYDHEYHIIPLTHIDKPYKSFSLMQGLDAFYEDLAEKERLRFYTQDILKVIKRELKRAQSKLPRLLDEQDMAQNSDHLREKGELLLSYHMQAKSGLKSVTLENWDHEMVTIDLKEHLNGIQNANDYFKRYKKAKTSLQYLEKQIEVTQDRIDYFTSLKNQTEMASIQDALEIREALENDGLIRKQKRKQSKSKRPNYIVVEYDPSTTIFIGKNNIQNEQITFKLAKKEDLWFHAAHTFGAHVILKTDNLTDELLELCAMFAAYYSKSRDSKNVEVQYTKVKNIKKIPGGKPGMVRMSQFQSLFITPDKEIMSAFVQQ